MYFLGMTFGLKLRQISGRMQAYLHACPESLEILDHNFGTVTHPSNLSPTWGYGGLKIPTLTVEAFTTCGIPACAVACALIRTRSQSRMTFVNFSRNWYILLISSFSFPFLFSKCNFWSRCYYRNSWIYSYLRSSFNLACLFCVSRY